LSGKALKPLQALDVVIQERPAFRRRIQEVPLPEKIAIRAKIAYNPAAQHAAEVMRSGR
jgi:hypothetical protein